MITKRIAWTTFAIGLAMFCMGAWALSIEVDTSAELAAAWNSAGIGK